MYRFSSVLFKVPANTISWAAHIPYLRHCSIYIACPTPITPSVVSGIQCIGYKDSESRAAESHHTLVAALVYEGEIREKSEPGLILAQDSVVFVWVKTDLGLVQNTLGQCAN